MKIVRGLTIAVSLFTLSVVVEAIYPVLSAVSVAGAEAEGPALKLRKAAKLHAGPSAPSAVIKVVWKGAVCIWLDKQDAWVQVRMRKSGDVGWIHHDYLAAASTTATAGE